MKMLGRILLGVLFLAATVFAVRRAIQIHKEIDGGSDEQ